MTEFHELKEKPGACIYCGNSPVPHVPTHIFNTVNVFIGKIFFLYARSSLAKRVSRFFAYIQFYTIGYFNAFSKFLRIIRYGTDPAKAATYRGQVLWEDAHAYGISMEQIIVYGKHTDIYRAVLPKHFISTGSHAMVIHFDGLPIPPWHVGTGPQWIDDKYLLKQVFRGAGIQSPESITVTTFEQAKKAWQRINGPVVCKPRIGSRARHTTVRITTEEELRAAFKIAQQLCRYVLVEAYIPGPVCRATLVKNKLVGFFRADAARVVGDGVSSISSLIDKKNLTKHDRVKEVVINDEHVSFLRKSGHTLESVLPAGEPQYISWRTGRLFGGETEELLPVVHPALKETLERAAAVIDTPIVGFDLICADPRMDPNTQSWGIIEANSVPFIDIHYLPLHGTPNRVGMAVWDLWRRA